MNNTRKYKKDKIKLTCNQYNKITRKILTLLVENDISRKELAERLKITETGLSLKINGHNDFTLPEVLELASMTNRTPNDIFLI